MLWQPKDIWFVSQEGLLPRDESELKYEWENDTFAGIFGIFGDKFTFWQLVFNTIIFSYQTLYPSKSASFLFCSIKI